MNELSIEPALWFGAELVVVGGNVASPFVVIAEVDDFVILIHEGDPGGEIGDEHEVALDVDVGWKDEGVVESFEVFAIEVEPLEASVGAVGHAESGGFTAPAIDSEAVGKVELALHFTGLADGGEVVAGGIVAVDAVSAIAVGDVKAAIAGMEGDVGGQEFLTAPISFGGDVLALVVAAGGHGSALIPDDFSVKGELGDGFHLLIAGDVKELLVALLVDFDTVPAALELAAEGANKTAFGIEDEDGRMIFPGRVAFVHDVEVLLGIDRDVMGNLPGKLVREDGPVVNHFVLMISFAENDGPAGLTGGGDVRKGEGGPRDERGLAEESTTGRTMHPAIMRNYEAKCRVQITWAFWEMGCLSRGAGVRAVPLLAVRQMFARPQSGLTER